MVDSREVDGTKDFNLKYFPKGYSSVYVAVRNG